MLAAVLKDFNDLVLEDIEKPEPGPTEAIVRVRSTGICGTDHKAVRGKRSNVEFPIILGHENSGVVESVGDAVRNFRPGDEVVVGPIGGCGVCRWCREGREYFCKNSYTTGGEGAAVTLPGGFAEYMRAPEPLLYARPENVTFEAASLTEPLSCAWKAMIEYARLGLGENVVVIGAGAIGSFAVMLAAAAGAARVVAVDTSDYALEAAGKLGATHAVNPSETDAREAVAGLLPDGADYVIEAAGVKPAVELALALRRRGTRVSIFGTTTPTEVTLDAGSVNNLESRIEGSFSTTPLAMSESLKLMERGAIDAERAVSHRFGLEDIHRAFEVMDSPERGKVLIVQEP